MSGICLNFPYDLNAFRDGLTVILPDTIRKLLTVWRSFIGNTDFEVSDFIDRKANSKINVVQWNLNKLENKLSAADAEWLAVVFEDAVVGDATSLYHKLTMFVENDDINDADTQP